MSAFNNYQLGLTTQIRFLIFLHENLLKALLVYCCGGDMQKSYNNILY